MRLAKIFYAECFLPHLVYHRYAFRNHHLLKKVFENFTL